MRTVIYELPEDGKIRQAAVYTIEPKKALIAYIRQSIFKDFHTWEYPETIKGMRQTNGRWYYDHGKTVIGALPA